MEIPLVMPLSQSSRSVPRRTIHRNKLRRVQAGVLGRTLLGILSLALAGCAATSQADEDALAAQRYQKLLAGLDISLPVTRAPFDEIHVEWKERLDQAYVYREYQGDYRYVHNALRSLIHAARARKLKRSGPAFVLYYDDPGEVPVAELRARVCLTVEPGATAIGDWKSDRLPMATVVYAVVAGPLHNLPRVYPALFAYLGKFGWVENGPIREVYLIEPGSVSNDEWLMSEVQVPWRAGS